MSYADQAKIPRNDVSAIKCTCSSPNSKERAERNVLPHFVSLQDDQQKTDHGARHGPKHDGKEGSLPSQKASHHPHELHVASAHGLDVPQLFPDPSDGKKRTAAEDQADE